MTTALYVQIDFICMFILFVLLKHLRKRSAPMPDEVSFHRLMIATFVTLLCDVIMILLDGVAGGFVRFVLNTSSAIYFSLTGYIGLKWLQYVDYKTHEDIHGLRSRTRWYFIPAVCLMILAVFSPWTNWLFGIDESNHYFRGGIFFTQVLLGLCYIAYSTVIALKYAFLQKTPAKRSEMLLLAAFIVLPLLGAIVQAFIYGLPMLWTGTTLSILIVFINLQNRLLSMDSLTGLNSRMQLDRYVAGMMDDPKTSNQISILIMDVQNFKHINSEYGHAMADSVLKTVSGILRKVCDNRNDFVARYGGDEFAIVCGNRDEAYLVGVATAIQRELDRTNQTSHNPFKISVGIGMAWFGQVPHDDFDGMVLRAAEQINQQRPLSGDAVTV